MTAPKSVTRWITAAAVLASAAIGPLAARPASAGSVPTVITSTSPVTWVDGQARQLLLATSGNSTITVARDTPVGDPDPTWGAGGVRTIAFTLPSGATTTSARIAADGQGRLTLVHSADGCTALPCDRWFQQIDGATGATVAGPFQVDDVPPPWRTLDDGSILVGSAGTAIGWYGPDGTERAGVLPVLTADLIDADVDASGRLLVLEADGTVQRFAAEGGPVLTVDTPCDPIAAETPYAAVGASPESSGFVVGCGVTGSGITVLRYADDGALSWSHDSTAAGSPTGYVTDATVTADGRAWVASRTATGFPWIPDGRGVVRVNWATSTDWQAAAYERRTGGVDHMDTGGGVVEMRPTGDGNEVALADLEVCCRYANSSSPQMAAHSAIVPYRAGPPLTRPGIPEIRLSRLDQLTVRFTGAPWVADRFNRNPEQYRVDVTADGATSSTTALDTGPSLPVTAGLPGTFAGGTLITATVTASNRDGEGIAGPSTATTVLPFRSVADFVDHQAATLGGRPLAADDRTASIASVTDGDHSPGSFMEEVITSGGAPLESVEPTARIYRAAFLRDADISGLRYWYAQHRSGTRIATIADQFARSSEFGRRYGTLTNRTFVERIYRNVLGRPGDPNGVAFWTKRLDTRKATRGSVLAGFSESGEFVRKTSGTVQPLTVTFLMLDRRPTAAEKATWSTAEAVYADMPEAILATQEYIDRINDR